MRPVLLLLGLVTTFVLVAAGCHPVPSDEPDGAADGDADVEADGDGDADAGGPDGDADADEGGPDGDADGDGEPEADVEPDVDYPHECEETADCLDPAASVCLDGACVPCEDGGGCAHLRATPVCDDGLCVACTADDTSACPPATPACDGGRCVLCTADDESACPPSAPRCEPSSHGCVECVEASDCDDLVDCSVDDCVANACVADTDLDDDGSECFVDCDDGSAARFPGNPELCDDLDNDCDGSPENDFAIDLAALRVSPAGTTRSTTDAAVARAGDALAVAYCEGGSSGRPMVAWVDSAGGVSWQRDPAEGASICRSVAVAWDGTHVAVVWANDSTVYGATLATDASFVVPRTAIATVTGFTDVALAWDGTRHCLAWGDRSAGHAVLLSASLSPLSTAGALTCTQDVEVAAGDSGFLVGCSSYTGSAYVPIFHPVTTTGTVGARTTLGTVTDLGSLGVAWTGSGFVGVVGDRTNDAVRTMPFSRAGVSTGSEATVLDRPSLPLTELLDVAVGAADLRGGGEGVGLTFVVGLSGTRAAYARRLDATGRGVGSNLLAVSLTAGDYEDCMVAVSPAPAGLAVAAADIQARETRVATIETCF